MFKYLLVTLVQFCSVICIASASPSLHKITPKSGDGIYSLLRRYHIEHECDKEHFLKINNLSLKSSIRSSKQYELPVYIYKYDGKSIRSTIGSDDWDKAVRIKEYNEKLHASGARSTAYTKSKILWVPYSEINCSDTPHKNVSKPKTEKTVNHSDLLGLKHGDVHIEDNSLKDKVFYIVAGHGGPDPGAVCTECPEVMCEDEYAYDIALRLYRNLLQHGATAHMIIQDKNDGIRDHKYLKCDRDEVTIEGKTIPLSQKKRLKQRSQLINKHYRKHKKEGAKEQVSVFLHVDSQSKNRRQDVFFYHHKKSKSGKKLAETVKEVFKKKYDKFQKNRGYKGYVKSRGLYVVNNTLPTSLFIELANIRNSDDHKRLILSENRQAVANWIFEGLIE